MSEVLAADQIRLKIVDLMAGVVDPSAGGGVSAQLASILSAQISGAGKIYLKTASGNTSWTQLAQSFNWYSVRDYGAIGNGIADDRPAIQAAQAACETAGGGVVYFPEGTYACSQDGTNGYSLLISATTSIQYVGAGGNSIIKQAGNAAGADWVLVKIAGAVDHVRFQDMRFDGSGLTNPTTGCHLLQIGDGTGAVTTVQVFGCHFTGMVAGSGDGVFMQGEAAARTQRVWVADSTFDGVGRYGVHITDSVNNVFVVDNFITNCVRDIVLSSAVDEGNNVISILGNHITHTGTDKLAIQIVGSADNLVSHLVLSNNVVIGGFVEISNVQWGTSIGNVVTSGDFASGNAAWRYFGSVTDVTCLGNFIDRTSGASAGPCIAVEAAGLVSPLRVNVRTNLLLQEVAGAGFVAFTDADRCPMTGNTGRATNAGSSTAYAFEVIAATVDVDNILVAGNSAAAAAGSYAGGVHLFASGANIVNALVQGNIGTQVDYGLVLEKAGGENVTGKIMYAGNNFDSAVGDVDQIGTAVVLIVGMNGGTFGAQFLTGSGSPAGVVTARPGSLYSDVTATGEPSVYYKESGTSTAGWLGIGGTGMVLGGGTTTTVATAVFLGSGFITLPTATELQIPVTRPATIRSLRVRIAGAGTGAANVTYTVRKNGVDTALTVTVANDAAAPTDASDLTHSFTVVAGDLISLGVTKDAPVAVGQTNIEASIEVA
jgi:hypothetical protein